MKIMLIAMILIPFNILAQDLRFSTERPTKIRAPQTVNPGHSMLESEFVNYSENGEADSQNLKLLQVLIRYGLTDNLEIQAKNTPINKPRVKVDGRWETTTGMSNTELGFKYNLQGNEGGNFSIAVQPYTVLPTSSANLGENDVEGGVSLPMSYSLPKGWTAAAMLEMNTISGGLDWQTTSIASANISHSLFIDSLVGYVEIYHEDGLNDKTSNITTLDFALQYDVYQHVKLDLGTFIGLSPAAEDVEVFAGGSFLF